ncbi:MAG: hypothetical protein B1H11_13640 [Desulfobacteraceae bacterium 4484_190.1]|nr:MAG: hypothetical protein B1H11_13640 [Desulfobacteraceae bacterium 4484_190.1]
MPDLQIVGDAFAATRLASDNAESINGDFNRIEVGRDSAGGNLAAELDMLADDSNAFANRLIRADIPVTYSGFVWKKRLNLEGYQLVKAERRVEAISFTAAPARSTTPPQQKNPWIIPLKSLNSTGTPASSSRFA